jgi:hypothetical protein
MPVPYCGDVNAASVIVLLRNPGYDAAGTLWQKRAEFRRALRSNLVHREQPFAFHLLNPAFAASPGGRYWRRALRAVLDEVDCEVVASRFAMIEFHGYHSKKWTALPITLPSQGSSSRSSKGRWTERR